MFGEFAPLYEAAARLGMSPSEVEELEIWQLASALGLAREGADEESDARDLTAERIAAAKGKGPRPRPRPPSAQARETLGMKGD